MKHGKHLLKVAVMGSGGKDGYLSYYKACKAGYKVDYFFNLSARGSNFVTFHNYHKDIIKLQSKAIGIPLFQKDIYPRKDDREKFQQELKIITSELVGKGVQGLVFGYILPGDYHRILAKRLCKELKLKLIEPLYSKNSKRLLSEFVRLGFKAVITNIDLTVLDRYWVGRLVDQNFIEYLEAKPDVDFCGDGGEYHTLVLDGPFFKKRIHIGKTSQVQIGNRCLLDIHSCHLVNKAQ